MMQQMTTYDWKRYWIKRGGNLNLDPRGYLVDPEDDTPYAGKTDLVTLEQLSDFQCLVLLSEPGMGKSTTVKEHCEAMRRLNAPGRIVSHHGLQAYGTEERLIRNVFETTQFKQWREGSSILHLFLDSLDECMFRITNLAALLEQQVDDLPFDRLRLRLVCRTAVWPAILEKHLEHCFPNEQLKILELAPLRYRDVEAAAKHHDVGPQSFTDAVWDANATSLALKPVTLNVLLRMYKEKGGLPATDRQLYEQGCKNLCEEQNRSRWSPTFRGELSVADKLEVASWLGFATTFAAKNIMRQDPLEEPPLAEEAPLDELSGLNATLPREHDIRDILDTGLFSSRGPSRLGWAHATYAEFLAARFIAKRGLPIAQIRSLLFHHEHSETIIPQLRETASWLASMRRDVFEEVVKKEPTVLLTGDVASADEKLRSLLVEQLLSAFARSEYVDDWYFGEHYNKLSHPNLAAQLVPYLDDRTRNLVARRAAIDIAGRCGEHTLQQSLLNIALEATESRSIRAHAVRAIGEVGDAAAKVQLSPLLTDLPDDEDREIWGLVLTILYPEHLTTAQVFEVLHAPRAPMRFREYSAFVVEFANALSIDDLPEALRWASATFGTKDQPGSFWRLHQRILELAWAHPERFTDDLAQLASRILTKRQSPFAEGRERPSRDGRRLVTRAVLALGDDSYVRAVGVGPDQLIDQGDFSWLMDEYAEAPQGPGAPSLASLILWASLDEPDVDLLCRAIELAEVHTGLRQAMCDLLDPVSLDSPRAASMRNEHAGRNRPQPKQRPQLQQRPLRDRDAARIRERVLSRCERSFGWQSWWMLTTALQLPVPRNYQPDPLEAAMTSFPGWISATEDIRQRITNLAKRYVLEGDPMNDEWFDSGDFSAFAARGGCRALSLLCEHDPHWVANLTSTQLERWIPIIVCFPGAPVAAAIIAVIRKCPEQFVTVLETAFANRPSPEADVKGTLHCCWSPKIASMLLAKAKTTSHEAFQDTLLAIGISKECSGFPALAWQIISTLDRKQHAPRRANLLDLVTRWALADSWPRLWDLMREHASEAKELWSRVAQVLHWQVDGLLRNLEPERIALLYIWLREHFPGQSRVHQRAVLSQEDRIIELRNSLLQYLRRQSNRPHLAAFRSIVDYFPNDENLKLNYAAARRDVARSTWAPSTMATLATLLNDAERRIVESESQLLAVVCESLHRFQVELHDELSAVRDLWDKCEKTWRPVDENDLSDRIARHFRADLESSGIIVNREVKIRRGRPGLKGEQPDIYVDSVVRNSGNNSIQRISVVIEVKGNWHDEVEDALDTQLAARYLRDNSSNHGLYLVGWFLDDGWDDGDSRKAKATRNFNGDIEQARVQLAKQAAEASVNGKTIKSFVLDARLRNANS
jgi:hypothetical protein